MNLHDLISDFESDFYSDLAIRSTEQASMSLSRIQGFTLFEGLFRCLF